MRKHIYGFFAARYHVKSFEELLNMGYEDFEMKMTSIPESEPIFNVIKSRAIKLEKIKDKDERRYWREMKDANKIPAIYLPTKELNAEVENKVKNGGIGKWKKN